MGWLDEETLALIGYGKQFQKHRRLFQDHLSKDKSTSYHTIQTREARVLLQNLLSDEKKRDIFIGR